MAIKTAIKGILKTAFLPYGIASTALAKIRGKEAQKQQTKEILTGAAIMTTAVTGGLAGARFIPKAAPVVKRALTSQSIPAKIAKSAAISAAGTGVYAIARKALAAPKAIATSGAGKAIAAGALTGAALGYGASKLSQSEAVTQQALNSSLTTGGTMGVLGKIGTALKNPYVAAGVGALSGAALGYGASRLKGYTATGRRKSSRSNIITKRGMKTLRKIKKYRKQIRKAMSAVGIKAATSKSKGFTPFKRRK